MISYSKIPLEGRSYRYFKENFPTFYIFFLHFFRDVIEWRQSRSKLYWRLKRRLHEKKLMSRIENTGANLNQGQKTELLRRWFTESEKPNAEKHHWEEDKAVAEWLEKQIKASTGSPMSKWTKTRVKSLQHSRGVAFFVRLTAPLNLCPIYLKLSLR